MKEESKEIGVEIAGVKLYTIPEVAKLLDVTPATVRRYVKQERLNSRRVGRSLLITESDIRKFIKTPQK